MRPGNPSAPAGAQTIEPFGASVAGSVADAELKGQLAVQAGRVLVASR